MDFRNPHSKQIDFSTRPKMSFSQDEWIKLRIDRISKETHNSKRFKLSLPDNASSFPVVSSFRLKGYDLSNNNAEVTKKYTPINSWDDGCLEFVIKYYKNGILTPYLFELGEDDYLEMNGPIENDLQYPFEDKVDIGMIAGVHYSFNTIYCLCRIVLSIFTCV